MASPSYCAKVGGADPNIETCTDISIALKKPKLDWSYATRKKMSLLKFDPAQSRITDYYKTIEKVEELVTSTPELIGMFNFSTGCLGSSQSSEISNSSSATKFCSFFRKIVENANKNADKTIPQVRRHDVVIKKFATSLLLYGGPMAYNLIQKNMESALPSLRTVQRIIQSQYHHLSEGQFQFNELVVHLTKHNAPFAVAISEDATRIIARVEYDKTTDGMVGFVLPCKEDGLPLYDSFLATSFEAIEYCFKSNQVSKYAYIYVAQCISPTIPAFCLACIGSNISFTAKDVLKRWKYIFEECKQRNITVVSFGGDGDSRLLKAMKISTQLKVQGIDKTLYSLSPSFSTLSLKFPNEWTWFWVEKPTSIPYIQDYVHVAVKLKSRLLKPSIMLPMGRYLAGSHHLKILFDTFAKDQHGIRQQDLNHRDKQNFDAVTRITSPSVLALLENFPDAKGTLKYLQLLRNFMDAFLDKGLSPLERIRKVWNSIFFLRYWHRWLCLNKKFTVKENFITSNANSGIELNGHALITLLILMRDIMPNGNELFCPWLLGSQPCEQTFRAARSMTGTFSTIINFSMYGLLNRLHRLQIQLQLESEMHETGIQYPRVIRHINKTGFSTETMLPNLNEISNNDICDVVKSAKADAISSLEDLGIFVKNKDGKWEELTVNNKGDATDNDDDDEGDDKDEDENDLSTMEEAKSSEEHCSEIVNEELQKDVSALEKAGLVDSKLFEKVRMKLTSSNTISFYSPDEEADTKQHHSHQKKHSEFIPVTHNSKTVYNRKTTAIWLFQECERISTDRLFRVRAKQPNSEFQINLSEKKFTSVKTLPQKLDMINVGDICVFKNNNMDSGI